MAEESLSDVESDSEFEEMLFSETQRELSVLDSFTWTFRFWRANGFVQGLISKNQFDRLQRLMDVLALPGNCSKYVLMHMLRQVLWTAVIKGKDETVRCMFRHLRALRSTVRVHWISDFEEIDDLQNYCLGARRGIAADRGRPAVGFVYIPNGKLVHFIFSLMPFSS